MSQNPPDSTRRKQATRDEKRDLILAAARQVFAQRGVVDVTMEDIAKAAKVSKGALYLHFASKDELYLQLTAQGGRALLVRAREASLAPTGFLAFRAMLEGYAQYCLEDLTQFRLECAWIAPEYRIDYAFPPAQEYRDAIVEVMRVAVATFVGGQRDGSIRPELDAALTVYQAWGAILGLVILHAKGTRPEAKPPQADPEVWCSLQTEPPSTFELNAAIPGMIEYTLAAVERRS